MPSTPALNGKAAATPAWKHGRVQPDDRPASRPRSVRSVVFARLRHGLVIFLALLIIEYLVIPELVGASKNLHLLGRLNVGWLVAGIVLEAGALLCYALLTRTLLLGGRPRLSTLVRIALATTAVAHVIPGGAAGGAGLGYQLLTSNGVEGTDAGFALATAALGSAIVLNVMLWLALLISIPLAGLHPIYVVIALVGLLALFGASALVYTFTRGEERAARFVRAVGRRIPRVGEDRLERLVRQIGDSVGHLARDRALLKRGLTWAGLNWVLDAASLWAFVAAFGHITDPIELFAAYGIANVLAAVPITPGGLGVIEASAATLLVSFGVTRTVATLGVLSWRLVNFWLPIPVGAAAYISLRVPRGSGLRARRQALSDMAAASRRPDDGTGATPEDGRHRHA
jgi:uncharacterized protein (TIRG00374 family)